MTDQAAHVLCLMGTRPEAIKMFPVVHALRRSAVFTPVVVTTGQHQDLVRPILEMADIEADANLGVGHPGLTLNELVSSVVDRFSAFCHARFGDRFPVACLVHGDTSSAVSAALAAFHLRIPVVHVEAGLRTRSTLSPFPEELNRQLIARIASWHLAPTSVNEENLVRERVPYEQVFVTGNTGIDALRHAAALPDVAFEDPAVGEADAGDGPLLLVTAHRRENWSGGLAAIATALGELAARRPDLRIVIPLHPNPLVREQLGAPLADLPNVILTEPLAYAPFARLMARATVILTDSGGIQEEAPALDVPVLVARASTERGEGVETGALRLVGTDPDTIEREVARLLDDPRERALMAAAPNPYGDGRAADRIVAGLEWIAGAGPPPRRFGPGFSRNVVLAAAGVRGGLLPPTPPETVAARDVQPDRSEEHDRWVGR